MPKEKVLVAASGGVDSTVAAQLLVDAGYEVSCAVFVMSPRHHAAAEAARRAADELGLPIEVLDLQKQFEEKVIRPFCAEYASGRTPSPCVFCNPLVKFDALCDCADRLGIRAVATGHYARVLRLEHGYAVAAADSAARDQSYMLYRLTQPQLSRLLLPLAEFPKQRIRAIAAAHGFSCSEAPDSEENCFIDGDDYAAFLEARDVHGKQGFFLLPDGRRIPHAGQHRYTVGQRKGLGIGGTLPLYVRELLPNGDISLCTAGGEYDAALTADDLVLNPNFSFEPGQRYSVKIRSAAKPAEAVTERLENGALTLRFPQPVRAAAAGQSAVLYRDGVVAAGGVIRSVVAAEAIL